MLSSNGRVNVNIICKPPSTTQVNLKKNFTAALRITYIKTGIQVTETKYVKPTIVPCCRKTVKITFSREGKLFLSRNKPPCKICNIIDMSSGEYTLPVYKH